MFHKLALENEILDSHVSTSRMLGLQLRITMSGFIRYWDQTQGFLHTRLALLSSQLHS